MEEALRKAAGEGGLEQEEAYLEHLLLVQQQEVLRRRQAAAREEPTARPATPSASRSEASLSPKASLSQLGSHIPSESEDSGHAPRRRPSHGASAHEAHAAHAAHAEHTSRPKSQDSHRDPLSRRSAPVTAVVPGSHSSRANSLASETQASESQAGHRGSGLRHRVLRQDRADQDELDGQDDGGHAGHAGPPLDLHSRDSKADERIERARLDFLHGVSAVTL